MQQRGKSKHFNWRNQRNRRTSTSKPTSEGLKNAHELAHSRISNGSSECCHPAFSASVLEEDPHILLLRVNRVKGWTTFIQRSNEMQTVNESVIQG